jgi:hypothetical protein
MQNPGGNNAESRTWGATRDEIADSKCIIQNLLDRQSRMLTEQECRILGLI